MFFNEAVIELTVHYKKIVCSHGKMPQRTSLDFDFNASRYHLFRGLKRACTELSLKKTSPKK